MAKEEILKQFETLKGIGRAKAESLYDHGFTSMDALQKASLDELKSVKGITEKLAQDVYRQLQKEKAKIPSSGDTKKKPLPQQTEKAPKPAPKSKAPSQSKETEAETREEETGYQVKKKPELSPDLQQRLHVRKQIKQRTPEFLREEWFRYKRVPKNWRRPDGITSKMRINKKYRPSKVRVGFRGPRETRGLHPSGFEEVMVFCLRDLETIDPKTQAARIGSTVGTRKRKELEKEAEEREIRILNR
jgi:large subunit ribosomal protein L32e